MEKGQRGQSSCSGQESDPAERGATLKDTPKTTQETFRVHLSWEGNQDPLPIPAPKHPGGMGNNGFSFPPCAAKMERQVERFRIASQETPPGASSTNDIIPANWLKFQPRNARIRHWNI